MQRTAVREVMTEQVVTASPAATLKEAAQMMRRHRVSGLPVVTDYGELVGIISEADLLGIEARRTPGERPQRLWSFFRRNRDVLRGPRIISDVMNASVTTTQPNESVRKAARRMIEKNVNRLPVVDGGRVVGILTRQDVLRVFERGDEDLAAVIHRFLVTCGFAPPEASIHVDVVDGIATLSGSVVYDGDCQVAGALAGSVDGTVDVINLLVGQHRDPAPRSLADDPGLRSTMSP